MSIRSHHSFNAVVLKFFLTCLLHASIFSTFVFAQDSHSLSGSTAGEKYFILIETQNNSLNVRKDPSSSSPIVGKLLKDSEVLLVDINGDGGTDGD